MFKFLFARSDARKQSTAAVRRPRTVRLEVEALEQRLTPSPLPVNATHPLVSQLAAATPGATLQIEPGATIGNLGTMAGSLNSAAAAGATTISVDHLYAVGQVISITTGANVDTELVDAVAVSIGNNVTLTLHSPLLFSHNSGDAVAPLSDTLGIGKAITIEGDPAHPAATLLNGLTLQYFAQNGAPGADVLHNLSLTAVSGTPSGNLSVTGDQFNITSGMIDPANVVTGGNLTIAGDKFSIGSSASLSSVISCGSVAGAMNLTNDTITATSNLGGDGIFLFGGSGSVTFSGDKLTADGTVGGGIVVVTGGAVSVSSTTLNLDGAVTDSGIELKSDACTLANITINAGATVGANGLFVNAGGDVVMSGTNTVTATGAVTTDGVDITGSASANVSNITVDLKSDVGGNALAITPSGDITLTGASVTVGGNVFDDGVDLGLANDTSGTITIANVTVVLDGTADYGLSAVAGGNLSVSGTESVTVTGAVGDGTYLYSQNGAVSVSTGIGVKLGSTATYGLYIDANDDNLTITGAANIKVRIAGPVSGAGAYLEALDNESLSGNITVTLAGTAAYGLDAQTSAGTLTNSGIISVSVAGLVSDFGAYFSGFGQTTLTHINVTLAEGSSMSGLDVYAANGNMSVRDVTVKVTAAVMDAGLYLDSGSGNISTSSINVNLSSTAGYGIYAGAGGSVTMTGTTVTVGDNLANDGIDLAGHSAITVSGMTATLKGASLYGFDAEAALSAVTVTGLTLSETGPAALDGASFASGAANVSVMNSSITLGQSAGDGVYAGASQGDVAVTGVSLKCSGDVASDGFQVSSEGSMTVAHNTIAMNGGVNSDALYVSSSGNATINKNTIGVKVGNALGIFAAVAGRLTLTNNNVNLLQQGTAAVLNAASGNPQTISGNTFDSNGGVGIAFSGGAGVVALVQANNFQGNQIGVQIKGDGTSAGDIDLGGGDLGSTGDNNFDGFNGVSGHYAIVLTHTNSTSRVFALHNIFTVSNANTTIQDGTHNTNGLGTGIISV